MRKNSLMVLVALALFTCNSIKTSAQKKDENLANLLVEKLNKDVQLTDSQKTVLLKRVQKHITRMEEAHKVNDLSQRQQKKQVASEEYQAFVDSLLTMPQREVLRQKYENRKNTTK